MSKKDRVLTEKMQKAYGVAVAYLSTISVHVDLVKRGCIGYFMSIQNIEEKVNSLDAKVWYETESAISRGISFNDLSEEDSVELQKVLSKLKESSSEGELKENCNLCLLLCNKFSNKILATQEEGEPAV